MPSARSVETYWQSSSPPLALRGLASLYAFGWRAYESLYRWGIKRRWVAPVPVIGVGSLWVGGMSKTPITAALAQGLAQSGRRVAILTHGYGGTRYRTTTLIEPNEYPPVEEVGDETLETRTLLPDIPIAVGKWRVPSARQAIARWEPEVLVLDDGFQHLPLARTVDLVALPADEPFGNRYCLPAGPLREPPSGVRRASAILGVGGTLESPQKMFEKSQVETNLTPLCPPSPRAERGEEQGIPPLRKRRGGKGVRSTPKMLSPPIDSLPTFSVRVEPTAWINLRTHERHPLSFLQGRSVALVSAIARPERFVHSVQALGVQVNATHLFADHHPFQASDLNAIDSKCLVMTLKDAVKVRPILPPEVDAYALIITATFSDAFWGWIFANLPQFQQESR